MTDINVEDLRNAVNALGKEKLVEQYSPEQLVALENLLAPDEQARQRAAELLGKDRPQDSIRPVTEMESEAGKMVGGSLAPLLTTGKGAQVGETVGRVVGAGVTRTPQGAEIVGKVGRFLGFGIESALLAGAGGSTGRQAEALYSNAVNDTEFDTSLKSALSAGGDEAMWDVAGNALFKTGGKLWNMMKFRPKDGTKELQETLNKQGTTLSLDQAVDNKVINFMGELLRGSTLSGGGFEKLASDQSDVVIKFYDDLVSDFVDVTRSGLERGGVSRMLKIAIEDGKALHQEAANVLFGKLDDAVILRAGEPEIVKTPTVGRMGGFVKEEVSTFKPPVDVSPVRGKAKAILNELENIGSVDPTGQGYKVLSDIAKGNNNLSFSQTHTLISELKRLQRDKDFKGVSSKRINSFITDLHKQFDSAAEGLPNDLAKRYKRARTFSKLGASRFNQDFIVKILNEDSPSVIAKMISKSTPEDIIRLRKALSLAEARGAKDSVGLWKKTQGAVLNEILPQRIEEIGKTAISADTRELNRMLRAVLSPEEYNRVKRGTKLVEQLAEREKKRNTVGYQQSLLLLGVGGAGYSTTDSGYGAILSLLAAPRMMAWAMTNKKVVNSLVALNKYDPSKPSYKLAVGKLLRLLGEGQAELEEAE